MLKKWNIPNWRNLHPLSKDNLKDNNELHLPSNLIVSQVSQVLSLNCVLCVSQIYDEWLDLNLSKSVTFLVYFHNETIWKYPRVQYITSSESFNVRCVTWYFFSSCTIFQCCVSFISESSILVRLGMLVRFICTFRIRYLFFFIFLHSYVSSVMAVCSKYIFT